MKKFMTSILTFLTIIIYITESSKADISNLENNYMKHRSVSAPPSLSFAERCLRAIILIDYPDYVNSPDYKSYTTYMNDDQKKQEQEAALGVCPKGDVLNNEVDPIARKIITALSADWKNAATKNAVEDNKQANNRKSELAKKTKPSEDSERTSIQLNCSLDIDSKNERSIGRIPIIPTGSQIVEGYAKGYQSRPDDESLLRRLISQSAEVSANKENFNAQIANARVSFFKTAPGTKAHDDAGDLFGNLLFAKDIYYLSLYIPEGTGTKAQTFVDSLNRITDGTNLDHGLGFSWTAFTQWVESVRAALHAPQPGTFWAFTPEQFSAALRNTINSYAIYKNKRDDNEYSDWSREHGIAPPIAKTADERINRYFSLIFDPAINSIFCQSDSVTKIQIVDDRKIYRAALFVWEGYNITPENVLSSFLIDDFHPNKNSATVEKDIAQAQRQQIERVEKFKSAIARRKQMGESDPQLISLEALQDTYYSIPNGASPKIDLSTIESTVRQKIATDDGIEEIQNEIKTKYKLMIPNYGYVRHRLISGLSVK